MFNSPGNSRVYGLPRRASVWVKGKIYSKNLRDRENDQTGYSPFYYGLGDRPRLLE
jgi:hypothetical protein